MLVLAAEVGAADDGLETRVTCDALDSALDLTGPQVRVVEQHEANDVGGLAGECLGLGVGHVTRFADCRRDALLGGSTKFLELAVEVIGD